MTIKLKWVGPDWKRLLQFLRQDVERFPKAGSMKVAELALRILRDETDRFRRTGDLRDSWEIRRKGPVTMAVESDEPYADIIDQGGMIRPIKKFLAVPLDPSVEDVPASSVPNLIAVFAGGASGILAKRQGRGLKPMYALKRQVRIRGDHYLTRAERRIEENLEGVASRFLFKATSRFTR